MNCHVQRAGMNPSGILAAIGHTPTIALERLYAGLPFRSYAKLEGMNPGGSLKDRSALSMLLQAIDDGEINPGDGTVIESSSGNLAIGLAQVCRYFDLRLICVVDIKTTAQNLAILRAYGAGIEVVREPDQATGEFLPARLRRVREILAGNKDWYWPNQYANLANPASHLCTIGEIHQALGPAVDFLFCATGSVGTLRGCSEYIRTHGLSWQLVAVDAVGSVIFGGQPSKRLIPGHGSSVRPNLYQPDLASHVVHVSDLDAVVWCHRMMRREALLAGGSSGAVAAAVDKMRDHIFDGATCVLILPDRGERYLQTIYQPAWVEEHFGDISELIEQRSSAEVSSC